MMHTARVCVCIGHYLTLSQWVASLRSSRFSWFHVVHQVCGECSCQLNFQTSQCIERTSYIIPYLSNKSNQINPFEMGIPKFDVHWKMVYIHISSSSAANTGNFLSVF